MATLTVATIAETGLTSTLAAAAAGGDQFANPEDQTTLFEIANASGGSINVTFATQVASAPVAGAGNVTLSNRVVAVANGARMLIGPFPARFNDASGFVQVTYSGVSSVTVGARRLVRVP
jgi:hypothetical protein